ncbi:MAG TPA: hypothetical protein VID47_02345, partial [Actinomycetota bacterium]
RVGALVEDFVDAYVGPAALRDEALADGRHEPSSLHDEAQALLDAVSRSDLEEDRAQWLLGQLRGLECVTARLSGDHVTWSDEVERCFGMRPRHADEREFRASHGRLDAVLPGAGDLAGRYNAWLDAAEVPRESTLRAIDALTAALRRRTAAIVDLPPGERAAFETVTGEPWQAFNQYRGDLFSLVQVSQDLPRSLIDLVDVVAHEAYPGHHTERACKEQLLYRDGSRLEMSVMIVPAPEAVIAEGIATNALEAAIRLDGLGALLDEAGDLGVRVDPDVAQVVHVEGWNLFGAGANVARMIHEDGISHEEAETYLREWALYPPDRAAKTVRFLTDPGSWTYATAYTDGRRLCRSFMDRTPDGFRRLLTEQVTVASLLHA